MWMLVWNNIARRRTQSALTVSITAITVLVFVLVLGVFQVMSQGIALSRNRLGADALLLPQGVEAGGEELLFSAIPENVYMPADILQQVEQFEGIARISPQFYSQTMEASCCDLGKETRVVGFDPDTDFILEPFFRERAYDRLADDELILGGNFGDYMGEKFFVLAYGFRVVGQLYPTGTGMDDTLFMNIDTARRISAESELLGALWEGKNPADYISVLMVKLEPGYDGECFAQQVRSSGLEIQCILTNETISALQSQLNVTAEVLFAIWIALLLVAALALIGRFSAMARERKKEIGLLRAIGLQKGKMFALIIGEAELMALMGGLLGSGGALLCMKPAIGMLQEAFSLSQSVWTAKLMLLCGGAGLLLAVLLGFLAAFLPAWRSASLDPQTAIAQSEVN